MTGLWGQPLEGLFGTAQNHPSDLNVYKIRKEYRERLLRKGYSVTLAEKIVSVYMMKKAGEKLNGRIAKAHGISTQWAYQLNRIANKEL